VIGLNLSFISEYLPYLRGKTLQKLGILCNILLKSRVYDFTLFHLYTCVEWRHHLSTESLKLIDVYLVLFADLLKKQTGIVEAEVFVNGKVLCLHSFKH
jgi:hypothetical protein